jgi:uncharacterized protein YgiM (DUF1202 family)
MLADTTHPRFFAVLASLSLFSARAGEDAMCDSNDPDTEVRSLQQPSSGWVDAGAILRATANALNLREGGGIAHRVFDVLYQNEEVEVVERSGQDGCIHVKSPSGATGWAFAEYLNAARTGSSGVRFPAG